MDPNATLNRLSNAIDTGDWSSAVEALTNYYQWRLKGGFEPMNGDKRADTLATRLQDAMEHLS